MISNSSKYYKRNFLISLSISLVLTILIFLFAPESSEQKSEIILEEKFIIPDYIPVTYLDQSSVSGKSILPKIMIPDVIDEPEMLGDVEIISTGKENTLAARSNGGFNDTSSNQENFIPRIVLEVLPDKNIDGLEGEIILKLKINGKGEVKEHQIISSSVECDTCVNSVVKAAYKSRWLANEKITNEYWVTKSYRFN